jgi:hypothetical protein
VATRWSRTQREYWKVRLEGHRSAHPCTTVVESTASKGGGKAYRSAITGRYVTKGTAQRHPETTVTENG